MSRQKHRNEFRDPADNMTPDEVLVVLGPDWSFWSPGLRHLWGVPGAICTAIKDWAYGMREEKDEDEDYTR